jgi:hypothetical protein
MKPVKTLVSVALLLLAFTVNAPAGEQQTPGAAAQPSPTPTNIVSTTATSTYPSLSDPEQSGDTIDTSDYLLFEALQALLSLY